MSITLGPFAFATEHLVFLLSCGLTFAIGALLARRQPYRLGDSLFRIIATGLIVARLFFVIRYYDTYATAPWQLLNVRDGGFTLWAGALAAVIMTAFEMRRAPLARWRLLISALLGAMLAVLLTLLSSHLQQDPELTDIALTNLDGQAVRLSEDYAGKPMVLNLWASWCPPCVREMPLLEAAAKEWPEINFIAVNQGENGATVQRFLTQQQLELPHVFLDPAAILGSRVGSQALPTTLFIHANGQVSSAHVGEFNAATLRNALRNLE